MPASASIMLAVVFLVAVVAGNVAQRWYMRRTGSDNEMVGCTAFSITGGLLVGMLYLIGRS